MLYYEGEKRLEKSLNIVKILNNIKYLKQLAKYEIRPSEETRQAIHQNQKNTIVIDLILEQSPQNKSKVVPEELNQIEISQNNNI